MVRNQSTETLLENPDWQHPDYRFTDFTDFSTLMHQGNIYVLTSVAGYQAVARHYFQTLVAENVRYVEVSIGVDGTFLRNVPVAEIVAAIYDVAPPELTVRVIGGINRRTKGGLDTPTVRAMLDTPGIVGIDLHGDERINSPEQFTELYAAARDKDYYLLRAHAGEFKDADMVRRTIDVLGVTRIEHGLSALDDEALIECLIADKITLDMCPTSNVKLGAVPSWKAHPIKKLLQRGVQVTCSTDDPAIFTTTPNNELRCLVEHLNFTAQELAQLQINAFWAVLLDEPVRQSFIADVEKLVRQVE